MFLGLLERCLIVISFIVMTAVSHKVAIIGGGITGSMVASTLSELDPKIIIHVFDQGRSGVGGRTSHRIVTQKSHSSDRNNDSLDHDILQWDHGCQFFRADTPKFQNVVHRWLQQSIVAEWKGTFLQNQNSAIDFFGLPSKPPFYVGIGGMHTIIRHLLYHTSPLIQVFSGHRIAKMDRNDETQKWSLSGTTGPAAFHDTPIESITSKTVTQDSLQSFGNDYDAVVVTDVSSSTFEEWHRASAGVPSDLAQRVKDRVPSRIPLFTCLLALDRPLLPQSVSAATFLDPTVWFAARSNSKPGLMDHLTCDCWTIVSTPEYAIQAIADTPMQDPVTLMFLPQDPEYLQRVPGHDLESAFRRLVASWMEPPETELPQTVYRTAQRWGSAMPSTRRRQPMSNTARMTQSITQSNPVVTVSNVAYDPTGWDDLAPTRIESHDGTTTSYIADISQMIFQAGDMVSQYTPGFEGAAISGIDVAHEIHHQLKLKETSRS
jgi:predicted NAD/FAD-dependent oxidoreductase